MRVIHFSGSLEIDNFALSEPTNPILANQTSISSVLQMRRLQDRSRTQLRCDMNKATRPALQHYRYLRRRHASPPRTSTTLIQGKGGDDSIDVSATGTNIVVFELDQASNGTDTVTGFTTGDTFQSDVIAFLGEADLRGDGDFVESSERARRLAPTPALSSSPPRLATPTRPRSTALEGLTGEHGRCVLRSSQGTGPMRHWCGRRSTAG